MRSGLSDYSEHEAFKTIVDQDPLHKWSFEELIQLVVPADKPNKVFAYRNINYHILGKIIETVSGMGYVDIYTGAIFTYQGEDIVLLVNGKITGSNGDATDLFYAFVEEFLPAASAGK